MRKGGEGMSKRQYWYLYFIHADGEMMLYVRDEEEFDPTKPPVRERWTPYHRVSHGNMPRLWRSVQAARNWLRYGSITLTERRSEVFVGAWESIEQVHTNPYGNPESTLKRRMKVRGN